jgi:uncharacterized integral membrane protein
MKRFLTWLVRILVCAVVITLCVVNRDAMTLSFFPLPYEITLPKFLFALLLFALGLLFGITRNSLKLLGARRKATREHRRTAALEEEIAALRTEARHARAEILPPETLPQI